MTRSLAKLITAIISAALFCLGLVLIVLTIDFVGSAELAPGRIESVGKIFVSGTKHVNILWFWPGACGAGALGAATLLFILQGRNASAHVEPKTNPIKPPRRP